MTKSTKAITNVDVVVVALARTGGAAKKVFSEVVAAEAYRLDPNRFGWQLQEYRAKGWPDKYIIKTALEDAKKLEYGALVQGRYANDTTKDGWTLTAPGAEWVAEHATRVAEQLRDARTRTGDRLPDRERARFLKQLKNQALFKRYRAGHLTSATPYEFTDMLSCSPDAPPDVIGAKFDRLRRLAYLTNDPDAIAFLAECAQQFYSFLKKVSPERPWGGSAK